MVSKNLMVLLVVALVSKTLHVKAAPAPAPAPAPVLGYLAWTHGIASGLATGLGLYGLLDIITEEDNNGKSQPIMFLMPQGGQPVSLSLRRNGDGTVGRKNQVQIIQLPSNIASTVQSLS